MTPQIGELYTHGGTGAEVVIIELANLYDAGGPIIVYKHYDGYVAASTLAAFNSWYRKVEFR